MSRHTCRYCGRTALSVCASCDRHPPVRVERTAAQKAAARAWRIGLHKMRLGLFQWYPGFVVEGACAGKWALVGGWAEFGRDFDRETQARIDADCAAFERAQGTRRAA